MAPHETECGAHKRSRTADLPPLRCLTKLWIKLLGYQCGRYGPIRYVTLWKRVDITARSAIHKKITRTFYGKMTKTPFLWMLFLTVSMTQSSRNCCLICFTTRVMPAEALNYMQMLIKTCIPYLCYFCRFIITGIRTDNSHVMCFYDCLQTFQWRQEVSTLDIFTTFIPTIPSI